MKVPRAAAAPLKRVLEPDEERPARVALARTLWGSYTRARAARVMLSSDWRRSASTLTLSPMHKPLHPERYREHLATSLLPFWASHSIDNEFGGFLTCLDREGRAFGTTKVSAMQARMIYAFVRGYEVLRDDAHLEVARQGMRFLVEEMRDRDAGGWFQTVARNGETVRPQKRLFDQAYVLLGLSVYARASGDLDVLERAVDTYDLLERHAWDDEHGGYYERCGPDWAVSSSDKTLVVQMDMLEAVGALAAITNRREHILRAEQLRELILSRMRDRRSGCFLEHFHRDWRYHPLRTRDVVQIGLNLKAIWLLPQGHGNTRDCEPATLAMGREVIDFCLEHGWDHRYGGFFQFVARNGSIARAEKQWWPMCDGILALLTLLAATGDSRYREYAAALEQFAFTHFADPEFGEWYTACHRDGSLLDTRKGGTGKAAYHTAQLCADALDLLPVRGGAPRA
jgi:mannose/cellobiose epimerase-like protein (N-acyl-D-glucosamine 2-epimerase family)